MRNITMTEVASWKEDVPVKAGYNKENGWGCIEGQD